MSKTLTKTWCLSNIETREQLLSSLANDFSINEKPGEPTTYYLLEDNNWNLWHSGAAFFRTDSHRYLLQTQNGSFSQTITGCKPRFWWDFPEGDLRDQLQRRIGLRALMTVHSMSLVFDAIELLNEDDKIVCRLQITDNRKRNITGVNTSDDVYITLTQLKGYLEEFNRAAAICHTILKTTADTPDLKTLFQEHGLQVKPKKSKQFGISAQMPAEAAVRTMSHAMFLNARTYEQGTIDDIDTEFLHDYRIAIRKARSLVHLMKATLPQDKQTAFKSHLAELVRPTNKLRDLDVFILDESHYRELLPDIYGEGLTSLFKNIRSERKSAYQQVVRFFKSAQYQKKCTKLENELAQQPEYLCAFSRKPILIAAKKRIWKRYQKIRHLGSIIDDSTSDVEVHALRIECKKLRYLMGFFAELFPAKRLQKLNKSLKSLQNILGSFNDYSIQKQFLAEHAENSESSDLIAAVGGLIAILHQKQVAERARVGTAFKKFGNEITAQEFKLMFD